MVTRTAAESRGSVSHGLESGRRKRNAARIRVTRACDRCKRKKIRCTGAQPCEICIRADTPCTYNASYARGRRPSVADTASSAAARLVPAAVHGSTPSGGDTIVGSGRMAFSGDDMGQEDMEDAPGEILGNGSTAPPPSHRSRVGQGEPPSRALGTVFAQPAPSSRTSPEPSQTDRQGHYVGPASGVSFLLRVQKRLHQTLVFSKTSSIFTFGDAPLPDFDPSFFVLPLRDEAQRLVDRYFDFAVPTHRFLHRPTVNAWLDEFYETMGTMRSKDDAPAKTALLLMVFAQAREYTPRSSGLVNDVSARYFLMADHQLSKERGEVRLTSVQARLCQCFYLLSLSRINHCWTLFGTTAHLALAIGLNRNRRADPVGGLNHVDVECRRRVFWCAYSLDNYLSAALGRPRTFHDADIDTELPSCIDDSDLHPSFPAAPPPARRGQSIMLAPVAHVKLSRIVSLILRDLYPIRPMSTSARSALTAKCSADLQSWHAEMAKFLDSDAVNAALLLPIYQRQRNVLNLAYWHATILTHRPFLLSNFARLQQNGTHARSPAHRLQAETSVRECLEAAMNIAELVDELVQSQQMFRAYWFTSYFAFCAVVVLYVYAIQQSSSTPATYQAYLDAATKCQNQIAGFAGTESLAHRYCLVLEELRLEAVRHSVERRDDAAYAQAAFPTAGTGDDAHALLNGDGGFDQFPMMDNGTGVLNPSPSISLADMTSWGNFDSMVTSGFGHLEGLLNTGESFGM